MSKENFFVNKSKLHKVIKNIIQSSTRLEKIELSVYERIPPSFRYRIFYGSSYQRWVAFLKESEYWSRDMLYTYQFEQAKNLLIHSMKNVPYYKKLFSDNGFNPEKMQNIDDLKVIPLLARETLRDRIFEFVDERVNLERFFKKYTSGSTGIPMTIYRSPESIGTFEAFRTNLLSRIGHTAKSKEVSLWAKIDVGKRKDIPFVKYGNKFILSIRYFTNEFLHNFIREIQKFDPEYISGYPSALTVLSGFIRRNRLSLCRQLKAVISYTETIYDWQRKLIEEAFGIRVFSMYAMTEASALAGGCEYVDNLHFFPQYSLIELKDLIEGHKEIIATGFTNYAMPLIRYRTGDMVTGSNEYCDKCGRFHPLVDKIEGRINDFLVNREGNIIPRLMPWIKIFPNTVQYQFFQEEIGKVYLKIVRAKTYSDADTKYILTRLNEMLGPMKDTISIEIVFVDDIEKTSSGKTLLVVQKLDMRKFLNFQ
jgi:phenylacetate-CoA ligase